VSRVVCKLANCQKVSVKGQNVNQQAQVPSFQDALKPFFVLFTQDNFTVKANME